MASIKFEERLSVDSFFMRELQKVTDARKKAEVMRGFMQINSSSEDHKKDHVKILDSEMQKLADITSANREYWKSGLIESQPPEEMAAETDAVSRNIKYAIKLTEDPPFRCAILTSEEKLAEYLENPHYKNHNLKSIRILAGEDAYSLIATFRRRFEAQR